MSHTAANPSVRKVVKDAAAGKGGTATLKDLIGAISGGYKAAMSRYPYKKRRRPGRGPGGPSKRPRVGTGGKRNARYSSFVRDLRRARRGVRVRVSKMAARGAMIKTETGGEVSDPQCTFVGHTTCAPEKVLRVIVMAILRKMFGLYGIKIKAFTDSPLEWVSPQGTANIGAFEYYWSDGEVSAVTQTTVSLLRADNYDDMVTSIVNSFKTTFGTVNQPQLHKFDLGINTQPSSGAAVENLPRRLECDKMYVTLTMNSELTIQNRTVAATAGTGDEHRDATDVQNNPLEGYSYYCNGNTFRLANRKNTGAHTEMGPDLTYGDITNTYTAFNTVDVHDGENTKRPPNAHFFKNTKRSGKQRIMPGGMLRSKLKWKKTYHVNKLMRLLEHWFHANTTEGTSVFIGTARVFAWEKLMHTRGLTEPDMNVGYECNNFYGAFVQCRAMGIVCEKDIA
jgi:hypothetical protein